MLNSFCSPKFRNPLLWSVCLLLCMACDSEIELPISAPAIISWSVQSESPESTRAMMDDASLRASCTPNYNGSHESIGIWGQYTIENSGQQTVYTEFDGVPLTFAAKATDTNPYNNWNYPGEARMWHSNAQYSFRACYPQALMESLMTEITPTILQGIVNTTDVQEDLLVASAYVDTNAAALSGPIPLNLQHIFAALKFKVKAADNYTPKSDELVTSCWLQNQSEATNLFSPSGYLVYSGNENPIISWYPYQSSIAPMYKWEHEGLAFASENALYTMNKGGRGHNYTNNEGWLLVVPQDVKEGTLHLCYTLKNTNDFVFTVPIPAITYTYGKRYTYALTISGSETEITVTVADWNQLDSTYDIHL